MKTPKPIRRRHKRMMTYLRTLDNPLDIDFRQVMQITGDIYMTAAVIKAVNGLRISIHEIVMRLQNTKPPQIIEYGGLIGGHNHVR